MVEVELVSETPVGGLSVAVQYFLLASNIENIQIWLKCPAAHIPLFVILSYFQIYHICPSWNVIQVPHFCKSKLDKFLMGLHTTRTPPYPIGKQPNIKLNINI